MAKVDDDIDALVESMPPVNDGKSAADAEEDGDVTERFADDSIKDLSGTSLTFGSKNGVQKKAVAGRSIHEVDLSVKEFQPVDKFLNDAASDVFDDKTYYKTALGGEGDAAQKLHTQLSKYLTCEDPKDRAVYRQNVIRLYWELLRGMAVKCGNAKMPMPKRMLVRFGVLLPSLFKPEQKEFFSKIIFENRLGESILYLDEWFKEILSGRMAPSVTDEKGRRVPKDPGEAAAYEQTRLMQLQQKNSGKVQSAENMVQMKENERGNLEMELKSLIEEICVHNMIYGMEPHRESYSEMQKKQFSQISDRLHRLARCDRDLSKAYDDFKEARGVYESVEDKIAQGPEIVTGNMGDLNAEFETVRQMAKMTVGRQGNQFPMFTREFYHCTEKGTGTRENVMEVLRWIESLDPGAFCRVYKNVPNRIVPYVLLVPCYGDRGFCWQPFDRYNISTSRARIAVPMYPRDLTIAVITAIADLRWQVAKEKASYYWMEEGLTGQYYQFIDRQKLKGELKNYFIEDYILWLTKESNGVQRLDKEVRGIFWRNMPFPKPLKEELRKRSLVYDELCIRDNNREMSDGY